VVDAGPLHAGAVAGGGGVVQREQQVVAGGQGQQRRQRAAQQAEGEVLGASAGGPEGTIGAAEVGGDAGGAEPGGDGASATGEEGAGQQAEQARGGAAFEGGGDGSEEAGQQGGQLREWHRRLLGRTYGAILSRHPVRDVAGDSYRGPTSTSAGERGPQQSTRITAVRNASAEADEDHAL